MDIRLRKALGWIALALPIILKIGGRLRDQIYWTDSISAYYYTSMRDVFVGALFAIGIFLFFYQGSDRKESLVTNVAGAAAVLIGLLPMDFAYTSFQYDTASTWHAAACQSIFSCGLSHGLLGYHIYAVGLFFALIAYLDIVLFTRLDRPIVTRKKRQRNKVYVACGVAMLVAFVWIAFLKATQSRASIFYPEWIAIGAFSLAWLTKAHIVPLLKDEANDAAAAPPGVAATV